MQDKAAYINSIVETLENNPYYTRHFDYRGRNTLMFLDLSNILCQAYDFSVWIDIADLVYIFSTLYELNGYYAYTSCNLSNGMVKFLYDTGFVVHQNPFDSDAIMGFTISDVSRESDVDLVILGTHDGGFRGVRDQLVQRGVHVAFLGFRDMFSHFLRSDLLFCFEDLNILSPMRETAKSVTVDNAEAQIEVQQSNSTLGL
jgi:hypothetical protein